MPIPKKKKNYVVVGVSAGLAVKVFGTPAGNAYQGINSATKAADIVQKQYPHLAVLVARVMPLEEE